jgi:hypothetical protein
VLNHIISGLRWGHLFKLLSLASWKRVFSRAITQWRGQRLRALVNCRYVELNLERTKQDDRVVVVDGQWDNPNYWFRIHLFLKSLPDADDYRLIGVLRKRSDTMQRQSFQSLGFRDFIYTEDDILKRSDFMAEAEAMLAGVVSNAQYLEINLPFGMPAYVYFDTVLKLARHPRPPVGSDIWKTVLADTLKNLAIFANLFERENVAHVIVSHAWKSEYAALCWVAIHQKIPAYHLTAYCEGIRIRKFESAVDFSTPIEHLSFEEYAALPAPMRIKIIADGEAYIAQRIQANSDDINTLYAYRPEQRELDRDAARRTLGVDDERPLIVVYGHVWFDFPHVFAMQNFTDFLDWMEVTVEQARLNQNVRWLIKPHPMDLWHGGVRLVDLIGELPPHISICPEETDSLTVQNASDAIVTVHGTIGIEAVCQGVPVLCADTNYYADWGFVHQAKSREDYVNALATVQHLPRPTAEQKERAFACAAIRFSPVPKDAGVMQIKCDASGNILYHDIMERLDHGEQSMQREIDAMRRWLQSDLSSYAIHTRLSNYERG